SGYRRGIQPTLRRRLVAHMAGQHFDERRTWDELRPEAEQMRRGHLAVDHAEVARLQLIAQALESDLRGVALDAEHRFAEEHPAQRDSIEPADQPLALPGLDRVREPQSMQLQVGSTHFR